MMRQNGFTLIEVLLALAIIAISITALLHATAQDVADTGRIRDKNISHWTAVQAISMIQLGLIDPQNSQQKTQLTKILGKKRYWRVQVDNTPVKHMQKLTVTVSLFSAGPYRDPLVGFRIVS